MPRDHALCRLAILVALSSLLGVGCREQKPPTPLVPGKAVEGEVGSGKAVVNVDNGTGEEFQIVVDGVERGLLKPFETVAFPVKAAKHKFVLRKGPAEVDSIETLVPAGQVTVINPRGACAYSKITATYTTSVFPGAGRAPYSETVSGQRAVQVDYGLLDAFPSSIQVQQRRSFFPPGVQTSTKTKLIRVPPDEMSAAEAVTVLTGNPNVYNSEGSTELSVTSYRALKAIQQAGEGDGLMDVLLQVVSKTTAGGYEQGQFLEEVFKALKPYEAQIPTAVVLGWLASAASSPGDFDAVKNRYAVNVLVARNDTTNLLAAFPKLAEGSRVAVMEASRSAASYELQGQLVSLALQNGSPATDGAVRNIVNDEGFLMTHSLAATLDAYIKGLPAGNSNQKSHKTSMEQMLAIALGRAMPAVDSTWACETLAVLAQHEEDGVAYAALRALTFRDGGGRFIAGVFPTLKEERRKYALSMQMTACNSAQQTVPGAMDLFIAGLKDNDDGIRSAAFENAANLHNYWKDRGAMKFLRDAAAREKVEAVRKSMEQRISYMQPLDGQQPVRSPAQAAQQVADKDPAAAGWPVLAVSGVGESKGGKSFCFINKKMVFEGDAVEGVNVTTIERTGVTVTCQGKTRVLPVGR